MKMEVNIMVLHVYLCDINTNSCTTTAPNYTLQKVKISKLSKVKYEHDHSLAPRSNVNVTSDFFSTSVSVLDRRFF